MAPRFSVGKSSVLYLCGADGSRNCSTPRKVWLQLRRSGGKGCPLRGGMSDRKRMAGGANMHCQPSLSSAEQRYIKAPRQPLLTIVSEPPRQLPAQAVHRLSFHLLCPALAEMEMECRADQRVLDSIGKTIAVQQIGLLSGSQLVQRRIQFLSAVLFGYRFAPAFGCEGRLWLRSAASVHHLRERHPDILSGSRGRLSYPPSVVQTERGLRECSPSWHCGSPVPHRSGFHTPSGVK